VFAWRRAGRPGTAAKSSAPGRATALVGALTGRLTVAAGGDLAIKRVAALAGDPVPATVRDVMDRAAVVPARGPGGALGCPRRHRLASLGVRPDGRRHRHRGKEAPCRHRRGVPHDRRQPVAVSNRGICARQRSGAD
jgi:hypothetical protein